MKHSIQRTASWLFNNNWDHFDLTEDRALSILQRFESVLPFIWRNDTPCFEPLYASKGGTARPKAIIGLGHRARTGKDTTALILKEQRAFIIESFAKPLKLMVKGLFNWTDEHVNGSLKEVVDPEIGKSPRYVLQKLGTDCFRDTLSPEIWIKCMELRWHDKVVIADVRFNNEAEFIKRHNGKLWRIDRNALSVNIHISEQDLLNYKSWDLIINNNGSLEKLSDTILAAIDRH